MKIKILILALCFLNLSFAADESSDYMNLSACEKQDVLWKKVQETRHEKLPKYSKLGIRQVFGLARQAIGAKVNKLSDFAPKGWVKYLHKRGAVAKVKFKSVGKHNYSGVFTGADCAILRLSLTYRPEAQEEYKVRKPGPRSRGYKIKKTKGKPVAPGLAFKVLRDGMPSANVSALYTLAGQGQNYNFFANPLSNIVPMGKSMGEKVIHKIFSKVGKYPEELKMKSMAEYNTKGQKAASVVEPRQIFFVPTGDINFAEDYHDIREDLLTLKANTTIYKVYAHNGSNLETSFKKYKIKDIPEHVKNSTLIGEIVLTSEFIASEFGDTGMFFKHDAQGY